MESATTPPIDAVSSIKHGATKRQIRGSSLLLVGRALSMAINFAVQVLIVRYLTQLDPTKSTFGAFTYVLSLVAMGETIATLGLDRAITRFIPIYHEHRDYNKLFGTIFLVVGTILALSVAMILFVFGFQQWIAQTLINDQLAVGLLLIMIGLSPVQALDGLLMGMFAIFASPRSIFFRKHVLAPGLKLLVVLLLIFSQSGVFFLAGGYLAAGALGVVLYTVILVRVLQNQGLFQHFNWQSMQIPARDIFTFTIPLLTSDLVYVLMNSSDAILLEHFRGTTEVAAFRAVQPAAGLNQLVISSFTLLFTPLAARLFARNDRDGLNNLYWQTAIWMAIISFPIFILTFSLAQPLTIILYGETYADSEVILALLSLGYYFNAALGFNGLTLKVFGKLRYIVVVNILAALVNVGINLLLIPRYGALGAAIGTCTTMIAHNIFKQAGLAFGTGISLFEWSHLKIYIIIALSALGLLAMQAVVGLVVQPGSYTHFALSLVLAMLVSLFVLMVNRKALKVNQTFPELLRFPLVRRLFGE